MMFPELKPWLQVKVEVLRYPMKDKFGDVGTPNSFNAVCYLEHKINEVTTRAGETVTSYTTAYFDATDESLFNGERVDIILPNKEVYPMKTRTLMYDRTGMLHLIKVYI